MARQLISKLAVSALAAVVLSGCGHASGLLLMPTPVLESFKEDLSGHKTLVVLPPKSDPDDKIPPQMLAAISRNAAAAFAAKGLSVDLKPLTAENYTGKTSEQIASQYAPADLYLETEILSWGAFWGDPLGGFRTVKGEFRLKTRDGKTIWQETERAIARPLGEGPSQAGGIGAGTHLGGDPLGLAAPLYIADAAIRAKATISDATEEPVFEEASRYAAAFCEMESTLIEEHFKPLPGFEPVEYKVKRDPNAKPQTPLWGGTHPRQAKK